MAGTGHGIVAGYDGSPGSEQALSWATREARAACLA
jgi:nucleotide-binding universal stress UspA family protein